MARLGFEDRAGVAAALQLERRAETGQPGAGDHHTQRRRRGHGRQFGERSGAERGAGGEAEPAEEVAPTERFGRAIGHDAKR